MAQYGYAGHILRVDLSNGNSERMETAGYSHRFIGGRGIAAKLYWDLVPPETRAFDPENGLICVTGPVAGFKGFASSRWQMCGKSPSGDREAFSYANFGGKWGIALKYAGYDGLAIQGKAEKPVYLLIENDRVEIKDASQYWGKTAFEACDMLKMEYGRSYSVITIGPAAENLVSFATILADDGSSGSAGLGGVMASKMLKAVVVAGGSRPEAADPEKLDNLAGQLREITKTAHYEHDLWKITESFKYQICYKCGIGCGRHSYQDTKGRKYKSLCQATMFYFFPILAYSGGEDSETRMLGTRLCDDYGLDTAVIHGMVDWLAFCHRESLLDEKQTGLPLSKIGGPEFIQALTQMIAYRQGFGDVLAEGTIKAAESVGERAKARIGDFVATRNSETKDYDPRIMPITALIYATEARRPIQTLHEPVELLFRWISWANKEENATFSSHQLRRFAERLWGSKEAADFTSIEGKALASKKAQDRAYVKESMILCDLSWMKIWSGYFAENMEEPALEWQIFSAVTGRDVDEAGLNWLGERNFNMQRAVLLRQGWDGRKDDQLMDYYFNQPLRKNELFCDPECIVPGKDGEIVSKEGAVIDRQDFETLKDEYYELRGWDVESGLPKADAFRQLDMNDIADDLNERGLIR
jgi:aldehyde:ferredoxin oxidoreductase